MMKHERGGEKLMRLQLLEFPREVRDMIYKECLQQNAGFYRVEEVDTKRGLRAAVKGLNRVETPSGWVYVCRTARVINTALLRTNKQVSAEARKILYGTVFKFKDPSGLLTFLVNLTPNNVSLLRQIELDDHWKVSRPERSELSAALSMLGPAVDLQSLRVPTLDKVPPSSHWKRPRYEAFDTKLGPAEFNREMSVADWVILVGRNLAKEIYRQMSTFLANFVRTAHLRKNSDPERNNTVDQLIGVLKVFETAITRGPRHLEPPPYGQLPDRHCNQHKHNKQCVLFGRSCIPSPFPVRPKREWTRERMDAMRQAMGEEILRLVEEDD
ncbi:unnamed protein product [Discula destructiva]